ncbi:MAG: tRNA (N(6)-L-threonylcarbamoyladenosine(37)-C(2))-methylthiotransferase MtaB, partial [Rhodobacterales bacterium]
LHKVLMENPRMGRTEQFTEVVFDCDQPEGAIVRARITGRVQGKLTGRAI